jgi:SAM-dependent methyltransferase
MTACRSCGAGALIPVLSLGRTPLANGLLSSDALSSPEPRYPLELAICSECSLVQILETLPPEALFGDYLYFSSFSDAMTASAKELVARQIAERSLGSSDLALEIASNDGYLLQHYQAGGVRVLGVEPAKNVARVAIAQRGIPTLVEFFGLQSARELKQLGVAAAIVHANNVLAHVPDVNGFVSGIGEILRDDGVAILEFPYVKEMVDKCEFDTIYHEHLSYFSLTSVDRLFRRCGLDVWDVESLTIHGGSLRIFAAKAGARPIGSRVVAMLEAEAAAGVALPEYYRDFSRRVSSLRDALRRFLSGLKAEGRTIAAYGAAAKGATLLNYFEIGTETLDFVVDRSPHKQGKFMPGVHVPVLPPQALLDRRPDYVLLLAWNFADEILQQQHEFRERGGRFIVPVPEPRVIG